jgi:epoxyqueuosine reductase QueG
MARTMIRWRRSSSGNAGNISVYARGRDYHDTLKSRLKQLAREFVAKTGAEVKVFVDTAPLMEKPLAAQAGLGWQGKHTNLVARTGLLVLHRHHPECGGAGVRR